MSPGSWNVASGLCQLVPLCRVAHSYSLLPRFWGDVELRMGVMVIVSWGCCWDVKHPSTLCYQGACASLMLLHRLDSSWGHLSLRTWVCSGCYTRDQGTEPTDLSFSHFFLFYYLEEVVFHPCFWTRHFVWSVYILFLLIDLGIWKENPGRNCVGMTQDPLVLWAHNQNPSELGNWRRGRCGNHIDSYLHLYVERSVNLHFYASLACFLYLS